MGLIMSWDMERGKIGPLGLDINSILVGWVIKGLR